MDLGVLRKGDNFQETPHPNEGNNCCEVAASSTDVFALKTWCYGLGFT